MPLKVLYEDNHLIAVFKPAGLLVQGDETGDKCLMDEVKNWLKEKYDKSGNLVHYLRKDKNKNITTVFDKPQKDEQRAELDYEVVKKIGDNSIVKINLKTGRPHQIRAQMSAIGNPILGDVKYGGEKWDKEKEIALCAT